MITYRTYLTETTLENVREYAFDAHVKHQNHSVFNPEMPPMEKLTILVEEVGEVAHELTYDASSSKEKLMKELLQTASVALTWYESLRD